MNNRDVADVGLQGGEAVLISDPNDALSRPAPEVADWPPLVPFSDKNLPPFPVEVLPQALRDFVEAVAEATQTPVDLAALLAQASVAAAVGNRVLLRAGPDWVEPACLYVAVALPPGSRKSAVHREVTAPITAWEVRENERLAPTIARSRSELDALIERKRHLEKAAAKLDDPTSRLAMTTEAQDIAESLEKLEVPVPPCVILDDATPEALAFEMNQQGGAIALMSPEGGGPVGILAGRYAANNAPNFDIFLKGHPRDTIKVNRRSHPPIFVEDPALTMALVIQPDVLRAIADVPGARGRGLLARIAFSLPENLVGRRNCDPQPIGDRVRDDWNGLITGLLNSLRAGQDQEPTEIRLSTTAESELLAFRRALEPELKPAGALGAIADWGSKLAGLVVRIAGIHHIVAFGVECEINATEIRGAIKIAAYLREHAIAAFGEMQTDDTMQQARWLADYLAQREIETFTVRGLFSQVARSRFAKTDDLNAALSELEARGYIRPRPEPPRRGAGRPQSPEYQLRPRPWGSAICATTEANPPSGQAVTEEEQGSDCLDTVAISTEYAEFAESTGGMEEVAL